MFYGINMPYIHRFVNLKKENRYILSGPSYLTLADLFIEVKQNGKKGKKAGTGKK